MDIKIDSKTQDEKALYVVCNDSEVELYIPRKGDSYDLIRTKIKINVPKKYTSVDIHIIQQKVFTELGVNTELKEIEPK